MRAAQAAVDKALELEPENGEAWALQGTLYVMRHEPQKAIAACRKALGLEPGNAELHALAGFALNFVGDYAKAGDHFHKALRLCPVCPNWYYLVGAQAEKATGNLDRCIELLRRCRATRLPGGSESAATMPAPAAWPRKSGNSTST